MKLFLILLYILIFISKSNLYSQSITPKTFNNGGGYSSTMEWSMGESVSIAHFSSPNYLLNTGVLQPLTNIVTGINEYGPSVFGNQITIGPNPTNNVLHISTRFNLAGNLSIQILDASMSIYLIQEAGTIFSNYEKDILMQSYPSGVFYVRVYFKPNIGVAKTGIYKIIKL